MDAKTIAVSVVSIAIACLFAVALLIPVIADSTVDEDTLVNEGLYYMSYVPENDSHQLVFTPSVGWTFDGETFGDVPNDCTIIGTDDLVIRGDGRARGIYSSTGTSAIDLTVTDTTLTGTFGTQTVDFSYDKIIIAVPEKSDLVMKAGTTNAYVLGDSSIEAYGYTSIQYAENGNNNVVIHIDGNVDDGFTITASPSGNLTIDYAVDNITTDATLDSSYIGLYKISTIEFDIIVTNSDDNADYTTHCTYNRIIVPSGVTAERSIHPDANTSAILNLIPLLVIVGIILGTVGFIALRKWR